MLNEWNDSNFGIWWFEGEAKLVHADASKWLLMLQLALMSFSFSLHNAVMPGAKFSELC